MSALPPDWAMGAMGLDIIGDPHVPDGVHLRVFSAGEIGLPVAPFVVYRASDRELQEATAGATRQEFVWTDSRQRVLSLPFTVTPDNPVTGTLMRAAGERAIAVIVQGLGDRVPTTHAGEAASNLTGITMHAFVDTANGRQTVASRTMAPHVVTAARIDGIVLQGAGTIRSAAWILARAPRVQRLKPAFFMDLPMESAARYVGLPAARDRAEARVKRGAPQRFGLHDDVTVAAPLAAAPATDADEMARVLPLADQLQEHLKAALDDTSTAPEAVRRGAALEEGIATDAVLRDVEVVSQGAVLAATADPGMARWLGFLERDPEAPVAPVVVYLVRGFFAIDPSRLELASAISLPAAARLTAPESVPGLPQPVPHVSVDGRSVYDFVLPVFVFRGAPNIPPQAPEVGAPLPPSALIGPTGTQPLQTGDALGTWLADVEPPAALRSLTLPLSGLTAACTLAFARREGAAPLVSLNTRNAASGRALSIVPARMESMGTGYGQVMDGEAPPGAVTYRLAQADWWGRWSGWSERLVPEKPRALPPAPVFTLHYTMADVEPVNDVPRFGSLIARVTLPRNSDLEAGSRSLTRIDVSGTIGGVPVVASQPLVQTTDKFMLVSIPAAAGIIERGESVEARINARWFDGTVHGPSGDEQRATCVDARPPAALTIDPTLRYSARPDAVGRSRIVLTWTGTANRRYRVYNTDETRLKAALRERPASDTASAALLTAVEAAPDINLRAEVWRTAPAALLTRELFTNLTPEPIAGSNIRWQHDLSASLEVLSFFRIVPVTLDNVEGLFSDATLLPVAVPAGGPPPRPLLDFDGFDSDGHAQLTVRIVRGPQQAARWRLRRSVAESETIRMPIVAEGTVPIADPQATGPIVFTIVDEGTDRFAGGALPAWTRMSWRVEVQAPSPPGSSTPGEWSPASGAVGSMRVPEAPTPPETLSLTVIDPPAVPVDPANPVAPPVPPKVELRWTYAGALPRGVQGGYRFDVYRRDPGSIDRRVQVVLADDPLSVSMAGGTMSWRVADTDGATGTTWRVVTIDPAGRVSAPSPLAIRS